MSNYKTFTERAQELGRQGFFVIPGLREIKGVAKGYTLEKMRVSATKNPDKIEGLWQDKRTVNPVVCCGAQYGYLVVDVDRGKGSGVDGMTTLASLEGQLGKLPAGPTVRTVNGGEHHYFKYPDGYKIGKYTTHKESGDPLPKIDILGNGGWAMGAGSHIDDPRKGDYGDYAWIDGRSPDDLPLPELPGPWIAFLDRVCGESAGHPERYTMPERIGQGGRNTELFKLACSLRAKGVPEVELADQVGAVNRERCSPPLSDSEVRTIVQSALRFPAGTPRGAGAGRPARARIHLDSLSMELDSLDVVVRFNLIAQKMEISGHDEEGRALSGDDLLVLLHDRLSERYSGATMEILSQYLGRIARSRSYNPVLERIQTVTWDGVSRLPQVFGILGIEEEDVLSRALIRKWLWQSMALQFNTPEKPFGADGCLVLNGPQGTGKTSFFRHLALNPDWFGEGCSIDDRDKDTMRRAVTTWICELGELESTLKSDIGRLRAFVTAGKDAYRLPYGRYDVEAPRRTSLCGTCNSPRYLVDPDGNRRWWSIPITRRIPHEEIEALDAVQLWAEIYADVSRMSHEERGKCFRLSPEEQEALAIRNGDFEKPSKGQLEIEDILAQAQEDPDAWAWEWVTISQWKERCPALRAYTVNQLGTALKRFPEVEERRDTKGRFKRLPVPTFQKRPWGLC